MSEIRNPRLRGRRLDPVEWRVREALSPFWSAWGWRFWSLLLCDEGIVAFEWPRRKYCRIMFLAGMRAGVAHLPTAVRGDVWPLSERSQDVKTRSAILFENSIISSIEVRRRRWFTNGICFICNDGKRWVFTAADPVKVVEYADKLNCYLQVLKKGWWPK
jgi:hypothetical protein